MPWLKTVYLECSFCFCCSNNVLRERDFSPSHLASTYKKNWRVAFVKWSVADPDVFGPPGSGSIRTRYGSGSGSFHHQTKIVRKTLISTVWWLFYDFLSLKKLCKCSFKKLSAKNLPLVRDTDQRFRIRTKMSQIRNTRIHLEWNQMICSFLGANPDLYPDLSYSEPKVGKVW